MPFFYFGFGKVKEGMKVGSRTRGFYDPKLTYFAREKERDRLL